MKDIFNKRQRFSIRKFSVGVASVLIGIALFTPSQGVLASTENNVATEIGANSEKENATPTVEKKEENQNSPENQGAISSPAPKDTPIGSTRTTELETSGNKENNSLTTGAFVAGEDRSSTSAVRAASNPSEIKKYELTKEDAKKIKAGVIGSEGNKLDSLLLNGPELSPEAYTDDDYLKDKDELYIYEKGGKKYVGYNSHPLLEDTDGDGIIDSKEKPDEKLKWNVSERDMIMFMELSYRDDNYIDRVLNHKKPLTESELYKKNGDSRPRYEYMMMNKELGPYWERKKSYHTSSGLDAVLYETKSDFSYLPNGTAQVLAFRGTSDAKDIGTDITLGLGSNPQQGIDAENIMRELAKDKSITNLYLTGHSLGGYLVQRAMVEAYQLAYSDSRVMSSKEQRAYRNFYNNVLKKGTTFNAPKVRTSYFSSSEFWQKGLDSKNIAKSGKMTHYIVNNDSTIGKSVSNDSDVVINVGDTKGGHSSRSYFEADMINRRSEFMSGKRISLDGTGYQDKKMTTAKSVEKVGETAVYSKRGDDIIKLTTVSIKDPDTGQITKNTLDEVFKKDGAKSTVVVTSIEPSVRYEKDATRAKGGKNVTTAGTSGTRTVTTTYTVNPADGSLIPHEGKPVIKQSTPTVVKVPAKDEVEYLKDGDDVVKKTTTYAVNASTGALTPTVRKDVANPKGAKSKIVVTPLKPNVRYEKDATRAKGEAKITVAGSSGTRTVTTTYTVNPADGSLIPHEGKPVIKQSTPTVVKVPAKDEVEYLKDGDDVVKKTTTYAVNASTGDLTPTETTEIFKRNGAKSTVVVTPIKPSIRYEKDATRSKGETNVTTAGTSGTRTVTTTYTVNPTDGSLIPHEGKPVIKSSTPTVVKVPAKDEVEYLKDGDDVVKKTTSYQVNASTGDLTPTEKKEILKQNGAKSKVVVTSIEPSVRYEKDATRAKGEANVTTAGTPGTSTVTTTYTVNPTDGSLVPHEEPAVVVPPKPTVVKVPAQDEVEYLKDGDDIVKKTTSYQVNASTGDLTPTETTEIFKRNGAKSTVVVTPIKPSIRYEKDATRSKGETNVTTAGTPGTRTVTTTYTVNPTDGSLVPHEEPAVVVSSKPTVVKVPAKDEVEYLKEGDNVVKKTTTYAVNASTGDLTPTETTEIFKRNGAKSTVVVTPIKPSVRYEKDATRAKGGANVTEAGTLGTRTVTTTYTVNPTDGSLVPHEEPAVVVSSKPTVVKVPAKDKVVETPIEPEVEYVEDVEKDFGTPDERTEGEKGKTVTTTTYDVDPKDGHITEHLGTPVVTPAGKTIVKVGAKTKVERNKDDQSRDVIDTITYEVDPKTGKVTPITVRTYGITKEPTTETRSVPSPVVYEKDDSRDKDSEPVRKAGTPGEETITTTYTVDPKTGKIRSVVGQPVRTKEPTNTVVKVGAKDKVVETPIEPEVEYVEDVEKDFGTPDERTEGEKGKTVTTTTYDVDPKDGHITEHLSNPVVTPAGKTIVKVGAKTKVEHSKDPEGRDVIDTITYGVDLKTGKVTPTTVRTYGIAKEPTTETRPVPSPVVYEKDDTKERGTTPTTVKGENGEDSITTTYTVDPNTGAITPTVGEPVRTKEPTETVVKVGTKPKVERTTDLEGREVITTTTYTVDPKTGEVTPTTTRTYGPTSKKGEPEVQTETPEYTNSISSNGVDGNGNLIDPPTVELPEFNGGVNGVLPDSIELPELMIEVRWIDEAGNGLKSSVKTGNEKDAEHGSILGYEFVRTVIAENEPVMTHIFRKVSGTPTPNPATPPKVTAENGELPSPITLPEVTIEVRWIDEAGNGLKSSVKTGNEKDAEHGSILGYEFVRTVIAENEPVMTHIFRKVSGTPTPNPATPPRVIAENGELPAPITLPEVTIEVRWIDEDGNVLKPSLKTGSEKDAEHGSILGYEFVRTVIAENEPVMTHVFSKVSGNTTPTPNPATPPKVTIFENGLLPDSIELPELMIEVRWIGEDGNVLKPSLKTGSEKGAEHGSISGYEFVRTVIDENEPVMTHIFRKVSSNTTPILVTPDTDGNFGHDTPALTTPVTPVIPDANGNSGQDTAVSPTPIPDAVTPNANHEDTTDFIDNRAKSNNSQNVLPNTGTESNATLASLGLLGMLGGLGLALGKKKED